MVSKKVRGKPKRRNPATLQSVVFPRPSAFARRNASERKVRVIISSVFPIRWRATRSATRFLARFIDRMSSTVSKRNARRRARYRAVTSLLRLAADWQLSALYSHDFLKTWCINHARIPYNLSAVKRPRVCVRKCTYEDALTRHSKTIHPPIYYDADRAHHFLIAYNFRDIDRGIEIAVRTQSTSCIAPMSAITTS